MTYKCFLNEIGHIKKNGGGGGCERHAASRCTVMTRQGNPVRSGTFIETGDAGRAEYKRVRSVHGSKVVVA